MSLFTFAELSIVFGPFFLLWTIMTYKTIIKYEKGLKAQEIKNEK